jgi:hypothetical protein
MSNNNNRGNTPTFALDKHANIGCLMYAMTFTRSYIAYVVSCAIQFSKQPNQMH